MWSSCLLLLAGPLAVACKVAGFVVFFACECVVVICAESGSLDLFILVKDPLV